MRAKSIFRHFQRLLFAAALLLLLFAGAGISLISHYCHGRLAGIALNPELGISNTIVCGCGDAAAASAFRKPTSATLSFSQTPCCSNVSLFLKLGDQLRNTQTQLRLLCALPAHIHFVAGLLPENASDRKQPSLHDTGPPVKRKTGRALILFLQQILITDSGAAC